MTPCENQVVRAAVRLANAWQAWNDCILKTDIDPRTLGLAEKINKAEIALHNAVNKLKKERKIAKNQKEAQLRWLNKNYPVG